MPLKLATLLLHTVDLKFEIVYMFIAIRSYPGLRF